jgi:aryl-alcohol dehydrogenase-like predicted oxidoreductase
MLSSTLQRCTPAQLALAWVLSRGRSIVPIAGTSHRRWLEEMRPLPRLAFPSPH